MNSCILDKLYKTKDQDKKQNQNGRKNDPSYKPDIFKNFPSDF